MTYSCPLFLTICLFGSLAFKPFANTRLSKTTREFIFSREFNIIVSGLRKISNLVRKFEKGVQ